MIVVVFVSLFLLLAGGIPLIIFLVDLKKKEARIVKMNARKEARANSVVPKSMHMMGSVFVMPEMERMPSQMIAGERPYASLVDLQPEVKPIAPAAPEVEYNQLQDVQYEAPDEYSRPKKRSRVRSGN